MNMKRKQQEAAAPAGRAGRMFEEVAEDLRELERSKAARASEGLAARLEKMEHKLAKLEMLTDISRSLNATLNLGELLNTIIDSIMQLAETDRGFLMLANESGALEFICARDREHRALDEHDFTVSSSIVNDVARSGTPLFLADVLGDSRFKNQESVLNLQLRTAVCVPLLLEQKVLGVIYTDSNRLGPELSQDDMSIIGAFAAQATIAIENAKLHGELVLSKESLARENLELKQELSTRYEFAGIIGHSKPMEEIFDTIRKIAPLSTTVLISGETGTGKELIARAIHFNGPRKSGQLVTINCGAMPEQLLESELFGHKKGSFTGAASDKAGLFETASGGTLFLDEIGEMPLALQVKLLRALQEGEIRRVGENKDRKVDVRVIAATHRDLMEAVKDGQFRRDLYYRLNVVPITIPPLRGRRDDIVPLTEHFLKKFASKMSKPSLGIETDALKLILTNSWPGNVRELENTIERAVALCGDSTVLTTEHFPQLLHDQDGILGQIEGHKSLKEKLHAVEKQIIIEALARAGGKIVKASQELNVSRQHLHNKIKQYGISAR